MNEFPLKGPSILNLNVIFSVYADGSICLDILQNKWSPTYDVSAILTSIQVIFKFLTLFINWYPTMLVHGFDMWYPTLVIPLLANFKFKLTML